MKITRRILSIFLIVSLLFVVLQTSVFATGIEDIPELRDYFSNGNTTNETSSGTNNVNNTNNTIGNNTNATNTNNTSSNETLPKTGITEDYAIIAFAIICGISAIYAYKKVKNYNIK